MNEPTNTAPSSGASNAPASTNTGPKAVFGGGSEPSVPKTPPTSERPPSQTPPSEPVPEPSEPTPTPSASTAPSTVAMTDEQLAQLAKKLTEGVRPSTPTTPEPPRQLTPEEQKQFDREFNVVRVNPELFQSILGFAPENESQLKALENFAHSIVRQAAAMTLYKVNEMVNEREGMLRERLTPIMQEHQVAQSRKIEETFFAKHPDLKDFSPLVTEVAKAVKAEGRTFKSHAEAIDFVANRARTLLGNRAPNSGTAQSTTQKPPQKPSMPTTSIGGRSGSNSSPRPESGPRAVFGDLDGSR